MLKSQEQEKEICGIIKFSNCMRKLTKIKLNEFNELTDSEMKSIRGGYGAEFEKKCPNGYSESQCVGSCEQEITYGNKTFWVVGSCHHSGVNDICTCVVGKDY